ncbi:MAG TPA: DUF1799 domain-containing protein [Myxococcota bacterium]|jgi:hypothetical protein|nr:DUF1799 domain-containing protein [Bacteroidales bacterium]HPC92861.1 DUF1799 domain-containing protein [Myxococcota bacterium]HRV18214.1 DUF1799 domain-containing protein [Myxococcota bacterium]
MYDPGPSEEELEAIGLLREDVEDTSDVEVWPENWVPFKVFNKVSTQWRVGAGGATGLDYSVVYSTMDRMKIKKQLAVLDAIRVMEASALSTMNRR